MNIFLKYLPKTLVYGQHIGTSKNSGIKVYKKILKNENSYKLTSFTKNDEVLKEITVQKEYIYSKKNKFKTIKEKIQTIVKNFKTGKIFNIQEEKNKFSTTLAKEVGSMDKDFCIDKNLKKVNTQICHKKNYYNNGKITTYPDGSTIYILKIKDNDAINESLLAVNVKMPNGVIVNRYINKNETITPTGEIIKKSKNPSFYISNTERRNI